MNNYFQGVETNLVWFVRHNPVVFYLQSKCLERSGDQGITNRPKLRLFESHKVCAVMLWEERGGGNHSSEPAVPASCLASRQAPCSSNPFLHLHSPPATPSFPLQPLRPPCRLRASLRPAGTCRPSGHIVDNKFCRYNGVLSPDPPPASAGQQGGAGRVKSVPASPSTAPPAPQWRPGWRPVEGRKCPQRHEWWMKRQEGMGSTHCGSCPSGFSLWATVCGIPHGLGEARLGTGRIHSLVNRWIPWCHSEPAAAPACPACLTKKRKPLVTPSSFAPAQPATLQLSSYSTELNNSTTIFTLDYLFWIILSIGWYGSQDQNSQFVCHNFRGLA